MTINQIDAKEVLLKLCDKILLANFLTGQQKNLLADEMISCLPEENQKEIKDIFTKLGL